MKVQDLLHPSKERDCVNGMSSSFSGNRGDVKEEGKATKQKERKISPQNF
jgi:hypothetical protein